MSAARARSIASLASVTTAFSEGLSLSIRARNVSTTSTDDTCRDRIISASSIADLNVNSSDNSHTFFERKLRRSAIFIERHYQSNSLAPLGAKFHVAPKGASKMRGRHCKL